MPRNVPTVGQRMRNNSERITVAKKRHTLKNTVMATPEKVIIFLGYTYAGHHHDYTMLKAELVPELDWFVGLSVLVDLGYLGIQTDYVGAQIQRPHKKPRKSKAQPDTCLTDAQKPDNKALSQVRILIEHAIGGMKRYNILVDRFRNHRQNFQDQVIALCAALWNFSLPY